MVSAFFYLFLQEFSLTLISLPVALLKIQLAYKLQHRIFTKQPSMKTNIRHSNFWKCQSQLPWGFWYFYKRYIWKTEIMIHIHTCKDFSKLKVSSTKINHIIIIFYKYKLWDNVELTEKSQSAISLNTCCNHLHFSFPSSAFSEGHYKLLSQAIFGI